MKKPIKRLISLIPTKTEEKKKVVVCSVCKFAVPVDSVHRRYYCINPDERSWIYFGEHSCGKGEIRGDNNGKSSN